jgi:hypothetical protein
VGITEFVLQEFRLHAADTADEAARIVAKLPDGIEPGVPLLRNIDDQRDVGELFDEREQRAALGPLVASWRPVKRYGPRITESASSPPSSYRLAVTESGINDREDQHTVAAPETAAADDAPRTHVGLMWVGTPIGTHAGLMVLLGSYDDATDRPDPRDWPLTLSRQLQVRIYETPR